MVPLSRALTKEGTLILTFFWPKIKKSLFANADRTWTEMEREIVSIGKGDDEWTEGPEILQYVGKKSVHGTGINTHVYPYL
jgi:hypothetical protein